MKILKFNLPKLFTHIGNSMPQWPHAVILTTGLNAATKLNLFPLDSLALLEGRIFEVEVLDTGGSASFTYREGLFRPLFSAPRIVDLSFRANLSSFLQLLIRQEDPDTLFFNRELSVEGDTELGLVVKNMLDAVEWPEILKLNRLSY